MAAGDSEGPGPLGPSAGLIRSGGVAGTVSWRDRSLSGGEGGVGDFYILCRRLGWSPGGGQEERVGQIVEL